MIEVQSSNSVHMINLRHSGLRWIRSAEGHTLETVVSACWYL